MALFGKIKTFNQNINQNITAMDAITTFPALTRDEFYKYLGIQHTNKGQRGSNAARIFAKNR